MARLQVQKRDASPFALRQQGNRALDAEQKKKNLALLNVVMEPTAPQTRARNWNFLCHTCRMCGTSQVAWRLMLHEPISKGTGGAAVSLALPRRSSRYLDQSSSS